MLLSSGHKKSMADCTGMLNITLVRSLSPGNVEERHILLFAGATLDDALQAVGWDNVVMACGVWGQLRSPRYVLQSGDRVELYRPLTVDPKVARRERFAKQGSRNTGLFAKRRPHSKAGY